MISYSDTISYTCSVLNVTIHVMSCNIVCLLQFSDVWIFTQLYWHVYMSEYSHDCIAMFIRLNIHTTLAVLSKYKKQMLEQPTSNIVYAWLCSCVRRFIPHCALLPRYQTQNAESQHAQRMSDYSYDIQQCFLHIAILVCQNIHMILCNTAKDTKTKCWKPTCTVDDVKGDMKLFDDVWEVCVCENARACVYVCVCV